MTPKEALDSIYECCGCSGAAGAGDALAALLRRDWAVRVLDAWAEDEPFRAWRSSNDVSDRRLTLYFTARQYDYYAALNPDAARHAAALAVLPSLPADVRAKLGECP